MSERDMRPPPCHRCGLVESARGPRHHCNPAHITAMTLGADAAGAVGHALIAAFRALTTGDGR